MLTSTQRPVEIGTYQVLLEIIKALRELQNNPKALEESAKAAYDIPEEIKQKASQAKIDIANYQEAIKTAKIEQEKAAQIMEEALRVQSENKELLEEINKKLAKIDSASKQQTRLAEEQKQKEKILLDKENDLNAYIKRLNDERVAIEEKQKSVDNFEASLKEKAEKMAAIAAG